MKFIHMADIHLDSPVATLAKIPNGANARRLEQREVIREIINYIKQNNIPYFFISGDLYEQEYIRKSSIEYLNNLFMKIPNTKIFITPGNHDPYINNSFYKTFNWNSNVHIFSNKLEIVQNGNVDIYGYGFNDFYMENSYPHIEVQNVDKINIFITHGNLDTGENSDKPYNQLNSKILKESKFDYIALGHIHKKSYNDYPGQKIVYPGSPISLGFDELGERGFIEGEINEETKKLSLKFIKTSAKTFEEKFLNITSINSMENLIETINNLNLDENKFYKLILIGKHNFEVNISQVQELLHPQNILKIKDESSTNYNIEEIAKQSNLKGIFANNILHKLEVATSEEEKEELIHAFEIGLEVLK